MEDYIFGFYLGISLILAIGPQNLFVIEQGLKRNHVFLVCFICSVSDFIFIVLGTVAFSYFSKSNPFIELLLNLLLLVFVLNFVLVMFFSSFYALLVLKPKDLSENLTKTSYSIPGLKQGKETTFYLKQVISRLAFLGGLFLAFLAFFPILLSNFFQISLFKNLTSLLILIGVLTDVSAQIKGYLVSQNYESYKKT